MVDFWKFRLVYFVISACVIAAGLFSIVTWGYKISIDFAGGSNLQYDLGKKVSKQQMNDLFKKQNIEVLNLGITGNVLNARTKALSDKQESALKTSIDNLFHTKVKVLQSETVGPVLGRETLIKTLVASLFAIAGILIYMSFAFKSFLFALSAILAMLHDFLVVIGSYSLLSHFFGAEVDIMFVTGVLTTMSFSVHDTIVIFDKIREYRGMGEKHVTAEGANRALTETMVRSLNNSMTIIFMLLALTLLGGSTIRFFMATLLIGTITGTYSSPFVATPILVWLEGRKK